MFLFPANNICGMNKVTWDFAFRFGKIVSMTLLMSRSVAVGWVEGFRVTYRNTATGRSVCRETELTGAQGRWASTVTKHHPRPLPPASLHLVEKPIRR